MTDVYQRVANPYLPLQEAVIVALRADPDLTAKARIYDYIPEDDPGPYVVYETAWLAARDAYRVPADRVWFQLSVFSQYRGYLEVNRVGADVEDVLRRASLDVAGFNVTGVHVIREQSHLTRTPDSRWRRLAITFVCPYVTAGRRSPSPEQGEP